jgi:hypothetical protein
MTAPGRGRPPIGAPMTIRLTATQRAALDARAKDEKVSAAEMVRRILADALA